MGIQFNLLPDVKLEYEQTKANQKKITAIAFIASAACLGLFLISFLAVGGLQHKQLNDADKKITDTNNQIKAIPNIQTILTVQNQLNSLPNLTAQKHITSRLFDYLPKLTPPNAGITDLIVDTTANNISVTGTADTVQTVNTFVDTLKTANYTTGSSKATLPAFSDVILGTINRDSSGSNYTLTANFDPALFSSGETVSLNVPQLTTQSLSQNLFTGTDQTKKAGQ